MGFFDNFFGGGRSPQRDANAYLDRIPGVGEKYYNPYIESGQKAGGVLQGEYGKLLDPSSFMDSIMKNYSLSKGAQYERDQLGRVIGASAAAGGYAGTPEHEKAYGDMADKIMSGDMQEYLKNALGIYGTGLSGEQDVYGKGYDASSSLADMLAGNLGSQAGMAFQDANQRNSNRTAFMNAIAKMLSTGAGAAAGGIPGAAVGSSMF